MNILWLVRALTCPIVYTATIDSILFNWAKMYSPAGKIRIKETRRRNAHRTTVNETEKKTHKYTHDCKYRDINNDHQSVCGATLSLAFFSSSFFAFCLSFHLYDKIELFASYLFKIVRAACSIKYGSKISVKCAPFTPKSQFSYFCWDFIQMTATVLNVMRKKIVGVIWICLSLSFSSYSQWICLFSPYVKWTRSEWCERCVWKSDEFIFFHVNEAYEWS